MTTTETRADLRQYGGDHYKNMAIEPWNVIDTWGADQAVGYFRGNVLKYIMRLDAKDSALINAKKAMHYAQKLVETLERADAGEAVI